MMYIHEEIIQAALGIGKKHDMNLVEIVSEMNHAAHVMLEMQGHYKKELEAA